MERGQGWGQSQLAGFPHLLPGVNMNQTLRLSPEELKRPMTRSRSGGIFPVSLFPQFYGGAWACPGKNFSWQTLPWREDCVLPTNHCCALSPRDLSYGRANLVSVLRTWSSESSHSVLPRRGLILG